ncbi:hypothetical protein ACJX0J_025175, partial [Zea mays]
IATFGVGFRLITFLPLFIGEGRIIASICDMGPAYNDKLIFEFLVSHARYMHALITTFACFCQIALVPSGKDIMLVEVLKSENFITILRPIMYPFGIKRPILLEIEEAQSCLVLEDECDYLKEKKDEEEVNERDEAEGPKDEGSIEETTSLWHKHAKRIADLESKIVAQTEAHEAEMVELREKFDEDNKNFEVEKSKQEIPEAKRDRVQKIIEELREEHCDHVKQMADEAARDNVGNLCLFVLEALRL